MPEISSSNQLYQIISNDNPYDECQHKKKDGKAIINAEAVELTIGFGDLSLIVFILIAGLLAGYLVDCWILVSFISLIGLVSLIDLIKLFKISKLIVKYPGGIVGISGFSGLSFINLIGLGFVERIKPIGFGVLNGSSTLADCWIIGLVLSGIGGISGFGGLSLVGVVVLVDLIGLVHLVGLVSRNSLINFIGINGLVGHTDLIGLIG